MPIVKYEHHGKVVSVRSDLKGRHADFCLCYACRKFVPNSPSDNCPIAQATFANCVKFGIVTPMWECPEYEVKA